MDRQLHFLILEDTASDAELIQRELRKAGFAFTAQTAQDKATFLKALDERAPDVLLADYSLPGFDGLSALALARERFPDVPGVVVSGAIGEEAAIEALKAGAADYVLKQRLDRLGPVVQRALREVRQLREKKLAQEELARQREWLRVTLTSIGDAVITTDTDGRITFLNPVAESLTGWGRDQALGRPIAGVFNLLNEKTREPGDDIVARVLKDRRAAVLANNTALVARDGREVPVEDSAAPILDAAGKLLGVVLVFHDVTQKRRVQDALRAERANLQAIFDVANVGLLLIDEAGVVQRINDTVSRWVGKDLSACLGNQPGDIVGCIHALADLGGCGRTSYCASCRIRQAFEAALRSGQPVHNAEAAAALWIDGKEVHLWLEVSADPLALDDRRHVILSLNNITARKQAEQAARQTAEELARSNKELEAFAYVASHDLQEPLRMVRGFLKLLEDRYAPQLDDKAREYIGYSVDGAARMSQLITDLLAYSRVDRKGEKLQPTDAGRALAGALANLRAGIQESGATVTREELPSVVGDGTQLTQLFQNLIGNALKFRHPDRPCQVHVSARRREGQWVFAVRDNGIGIPPEQCERVFVIFQRLHTREEYPGTGIGLAICKKIVERHGGRIWIESKADEGSTFCFTLPEGRAT